MSVSIKKVSSSFIRPADTTQYTAADLVANSVTAGSVLPLSFSVGTGDSRITGAYITKTSTGITTADFTLHLFGTSPTVTNGDNGAFTFSTSQKFADLDFPTMFAATDGAWTFLTAQLIDWTTGTGLVFGLIEVDGTYTPASAETFTATLIIEKT